MKMRFSKQVYDQFDDASREGLKEVSCECVREGRANDNCEYCDGGGVVWEAALSLEEEAAIEENLRSQGVPIGKKGTN